MISLTMDNCQSMMQQYFQDTKNYLYGAGMTGRRYLRMLNALGFSVDGFIDDDINKHGTSCEGVPVYSYDEFLRIAESFPVNVIISNIYGNMVVSKLERAQANIFEAFSIYEKQYKASLGQNLKRTISRASWLARLERVKSFCRDEESIGILDVFRDLQEDVLPYDKISNLASREDHYFVKEVKQCMKSPVCILDCGAYTGDIIWQINRSKIPVNKIYAIEANPPIYEKLKENIKNSNLEDKMIPIEIALWDSEGILNFEVENDEDTAGHLSDVSRGGASVHTKRIDDMFPEEHVDFVKMDIEGAELPALKGAAYLLKRCRPILAISIYHSLDDLVNIPLYLRDLLDGYTFFVRHHSLIFSETVLYGIPIEKTDA